MILTTRRSYQREILVKHLKRSKVLKAAGYDFSTQPYFVEYANKEMLADKYYK